MEITHLTKEKHFGTINSMETAQEDRVIVFDDLQFKGSLSSSLKRHFYSATTSAALVSRPVDGITTFHLILGSEYIPLHEHYTLLPNLYEDCVEPMTIQLSLEDKHLHLKFNDEIVAMRWNKVLREAIAECIYTSTFTSPELSIESIENAIVQTQILVSSVNCHTLRARRLIQLKTKLGSFLANISITTSQEEARAVYDEVAYDPLMHDDSNLALLRTVIPELHTEAHIRQMLLKKQQLQHTGRIRNCLVSPFDRKRRVLRDISNTALSTNTQTDDLPIKQASSTKKDHVDTSIVEPNILLSPRATSIINDPDILAAVPTSPENSADIAEPAAAFLPSSSRWHMQHRTSTPSCAPELSTRCTVSMTNVYQCLALLFLLGGAALWIVLTAYVSTRPVYFNSAFHRRQHIPTKVISPLSPLEPLDMTNIRSILDEEEPSIWENASDLMQELTEKYLTKRVHLTVKYEVEDNQ